MLMVHRILQDDSYNRQGGYGTSATATTATAAATLGVAACMPFLLSGNLCVLQMRPSSPGQIQTLAQMWHSAFRRLRAAVPSGRLPATVMGPAALFETCNIDGTGSASCHSMHRRQWPTFATSDSLLASRACCAEPCAELVVACCVLRAAGNTSCGHSQTVIQNTQVCLVLRCSISSSAQPAAQNASLWLGEAAGLQEARCNTLIDSVQ